MSQYIMRLDDASEYMNVEKWQQMENLLDRYNIKPIVGIIPENHDPDMVDVYPRNPAFWDKVRCWKEKGWTLALHGYTHVFETNCGGMNPVNDRSEFAGVPLERQKEKIRLGCSVLKAHDIEPKIFFAPAHTFDENTLIALKEESEIRVISDTIANDVYCQDGFYFIPQQSGRARKLPFKICTFCYHPNIIEDSSFIELHDFFEANREKFIDPSIITLRKRSKSLIDNTIKRLYFLRRRR